MINKLSILGFRGFGDEQFLELAVPNTEPGSGLTVLVGPNNSGKSSIIECLKAISSRGHASPSFTEGKRNKAAGDIVSMAVYDDGGGKLTLKTAEQGGSETFFHEEGIKRANFFAFVLSSRRAFNPYFNKNSSDRNAFFANEQVSAQRGVSRDLFQYRLFHILQNNRDAFNDVLSKIIDPVPNWTIDQSDSGNYYV
ncbi:ATP-binding protein [Dyadobacter chenwenxiniae]|uniref:ATP-binding protein n=1 Tax=Dyadobacter chenwenxiniae TaxID=2906456 RepID=A0A9X1PMP1_9BACT|nr:AAA family ATPase [Dyadobacter chenwenxiniae]MCF0062789.1 ATP-binding protein [Dyadobacter chenwenxiniae]UON85036.1 ATP-binding protein [Dyadobacter chenwenxiniae]